MSEGAKKGMVINLEEGVLDELSIIKQFDKVRKGTPSSLKEYVGDHIVAPFVDLRLYFEEENFPAVTMNEILAFFKRSANLQDFQKFLNKKKVA